MNTTLKNIALALTCVLIGYLIGLLPLHSQTYSTSGSSGTPTLTSCGVAPVVSGTDTLGAITLGSGLVTSCTLQFSAALVSAPICVITTNSLMVQAAITSLDNTQFTVGLSGSLPGGNLYYFCPLK